MNHSCECGPPPENGKVFCPRHQCEKTLFLWQKCQERGRFWDAWEAGAGPGQPKKPVITSIRCVIRPQWQDMERRSHAAMSLVGVPRWIEMVRPPMVALDRAIADNNPSIVFSHAFAVKSTDTIHLAAKYPHVAFCVVDHSSLNHTLTWPEHFEDERRILEASESHQNLWYASPDAWCQWTQFGYTQYRHWPNPVYVPPYTPPPVLDRPCVCIASRVDWMKALPSQISAAALLQKERNVRVVVALRDQQNAKYRGLINHARACKLDFEEVPWLSPDGWLDFLRTQVSVLLQPSLSDSFNYASIDAASVGRPFVGSPAIRHTPSEWTVANCNDISEIAAVTGRILDDYETEADKARPLAEAVAEWNNWKFAAFLQELLASRAEPPATTKKPRGCGGCGKGLASMAWDLTKSLAAFVSDGMKLVDAEEYRRRLSECDACPHRTGQRCGLCGCFVALKAKGRAWQCPDGRWEKE